MCSEAHERSSGRVLKSSNTTGLPSICIFSRSSCCLPGRLSDEREEYSKSMMVSSPRAMTTTSDFPASWSALLHLTIRLFWCPRRLYLRTNKPIERGGECLDYLYAL